MVRSKCAQFALKRSMWNYNLVTGNWDAVRANIDDIVDFMAVVVSRRNSSLRIQRLRELSLPPPSFHMSLSVMKKMPRLSTRTCRLEPPPTPPSTLSRRHSNLTTAGAWALMETSLEIYGTMMLVTTTIEPSPLNNKYCPTIRMHVKLLWSNFCCIQLTSSLFILVRGYGCSWFSPKSVLCNTSTIWFLSRRLSNPLTSLISTQIHFAWGKTIQEQMCERRCHAGR